jgi:hypothetical protein
MTATSALPHLYLHSTHAVDDTADVGCYPGLILHCALLLHHYLIYVLLC